MYPVGVPMITGPIPLDEQEVQSVARLENVPEKQIESCAKNRGLWRPRGGSLSPQEGDLIVFSIGNKPGVPHAGVVTDVYPDGSVRVQAEKSLRSGKTGDVMDERLKVNGSEIRGIISKRRTNPSFGEKLLRDLLMDQGLLNVHKGLKNLVADVLQCTKKKEEKNHGNDSYHPH